jgi:hypothetical protein
MGEFMASLQGHDVEDVTPMVDGGQPDLVVDGHELLELVEPSSRMRFHPFVLVQARPRMEHENYQRITFDGSLEWTVDQQNGTTRTYTPVFSVNSQTFRWGLTSVEDTVGNTVTYNWWCDGTDDCYPDNVTYNGYRVQIYYRDDRTDIMSFATGVLPVHSTGWRSPIIPTASRTLELHEVFTDESRRSPRSGRRERMRFSLAPREWHRAGSSDPIPGRPHRREHGL